MTRQQKNSLVQFVCQDLPEDVRDAIAENYEYNQEERY